MKFPTHSTLLFQGDSITECLRDKSIHEANDTQALGHGYAKLASAKLFASQPQDALTIYNRGIGGNRSECMLARWDTDAIALKPTHISILIGVNDSWQINNHVDLKRYETALENIIYKTKKVLPDIKWIFCEPFAFTSEHFSQAQVDEVAQRCEIIHQLAAKTQAVIVPFAQMFASAAKEAPEHYWLPDGVHPSLGAHQRMAECWLDAVAKA